MKKILISTILAAFYAFSASADTNIGISISSASMEATGSHTTDSASSNSGGDAVTASGDGDFSLASFFYREGSVCWWFKYCNRFRCNTNDY